MSRPSHRKLSPLPKRTTEALLTLAAFAADATAADSDMADAIALVEAAGAGAPMTAELKAICKHHSIAPGDLAPLRGAIASRNAPALKSRAVLK